MPEKQADANQVEAHSARRMIGVSLLTFAILAIWQGGNHGWLREDLQTALFPLVLLGLTLSSSTRGGFAVPRILLGCAAILWFIGALNVRGLLPGAAPDAGIVVTRLASDPAGERAQELKQRLVELAHYYSLLPATQVPIRLNSDRAAQDWLRRSHSRAPLIRGDATWQRLVLPPAAGFLPVSHGENDERFEEIESELAQLGVNSPNGMTTIRLPGVEAPLVAVSMPEGIDLSEEPKELTRNYLVWLLPVFAPAKELVRLAIPQFPAASREVVQQWGLALRQYYGQIAFDISGPWRSSEPLALALFLRANATLAESLTASSSFSTAIDRRALQCAIDLYERALGLTRNTAPDELTAATLNNLAVACLLSPARDVTCKLSFRRLEDAMAVSSKEGKPVRGAVAAYWNLRIVRRDGIF